ncbi:MAG TPA: DUF4391 domain-containing protein [Nitrosomonas nitrosa]|nr:DUF4391 domain-containing protein [Nitrosomonas nitrosa]
MTFKKTGITSFDNFIQYLDIPKACELNKPIYKKMFLDNGILDTTDKACLKGDVDKIRWLYTLKPSTINIAPHIDSEREYPEVAVLHAELSNPKRIKRIAHFINRSIPYPLVLLFTHHSDGQNYLAICLADKRINQADKEKWVIKDSIYSGWISFTNQNNLEAAFLASLHMSNLPFKNFWNFYQALMERVIAMNCAHHSGSFTLASDNKQKNRLEILRELEKLDAQKAEIANKLKKEKQMGKQVDLNTQVKNINDKIAQIKSSL